jgi:hypothetical protein
MAVIARAPDPEGPWQEALRVHFFGGFAVDARGETPVIWVGDEGGSVFRSDDGGDSFVDAYPSLASACLAQGPDALWSCTPGSTRQTALSSLPRGAQAFEPMMAASAAANLRIVHLTASGRCPSRNRIFLFAARTDRRFNSAPTARRATVIVARNGRRIPGR